MRIPSEIIEASAGSGKTYALTNRFIKLMAFGVEPEKIVALTFTRKAAGEFFDAILQKLADAAEDEGKAKSLGKELDCPEFQREDFLRLLKQLVRTMHQLSLGTLDSFFVRVVGAFPLEFGLGGDFSVIADDSQIEQLRTRIRDRVFREALATKDGLANFLEAFKQATFGLEDNRFSANLDRFIKDHQGLYLEVPDGARWGKAAAIWPDGSFSASGAGDSAVNQAVARLEEVVSGLEQNEKQLDRWRLFFDQARGTTACTPLPKPVDYIMNAFLNVVDDLRDGHAKVTVERRKVELDAAACQAALDYVEAMLAREIAVKLTSTQGLWRIINAYEKCYDDNIRRRGQLQFDDVVRIVARGGVLSSDGGQGMGLDLAYRLDAKFDHWLLDEFQDTSRIQWKAISGLIDEVVQDSEGRRSYFQVGDTKQSIYGWRGGDPNLFGEILERYRRALDVRSLTVSYRSCPQVVETVNQVFNNSRALKTLLPAKAVDAFHFEEHSCSSQTSELQGYVGLWHPDVDSATTEQVLDVVVATIREVDPLTRGLSCAVLCRGKEMVRQVMDHLRASGIGEVSGGTKPCVATDNPVTLAMLSLIKLTGHPGDGFAFGHLKMTPIGEWIEREGMTKGDLVMEGLSTIHSLGFEGLVELWGQRMNEGGHLQDAFAHHRWRALQEMARYYDDTGERSVDGFLHYAEGYQMQEESGKNAIQVMTIHRSKGLGFDVVILPELEGGKSLTLVDSGLTKGGDEENPWVLDMPKKEYQKLDAVLAANLDEKEADSGFESLCVLYVAMTRAKRGLYLLSAERKKTSIALNFLTVLDATLGELDGDEEKTQTVVGDEPVRISYESGGRRWYEDIPCGSGDAVEEGGGGEEGIGIELGPNPHRARHRSASEQEPRYRDAGQLFSPAGSAAREYGNEMHAVFEQIEWVEEGQDLTKMLAGIQVKEEIAEDVRECLQTPGVRALFTRPGGAEGEQRLRFEVWREKAFESVIDDMWVSGVFDRVVLARDRETGKVSRADIIDYKTSRVEEGEEVDAEAERHRSQMEAYREALANLTGLAAEKISCQLVFTRPRVVKKMVFPQRHGVSQRKKNR